MQTSLNSPKTAFRSWLVALGFAFLALAPSLSFAQSACTAMWGIVTTGGAAPTRLGFFNNSAGTASKFTTLSFTLSGGTNANGLAGDPATGLLYYFDRSAGAQTVNRIDLNTMTTSTVGTITPGSPDTGSNTAIIGAVIDANSNLIMMTSNGTGNTAYHMAIVSKAGNTTGARWQTVTYTAGLGGGLPFSGGSGDVYIDQSNQMWLATNTNPTAVYPINLTIVNGSITSALAGASTTFTAGGISVAGVSVDPATGLSYYGGAQTGQIMYRFDPATGGSQVLVDATASTLYTSSDMGNCVSQPAPPTVSKIITPTYKAGGIGNTTATLTISLGNSNTVPIWLMRDFRDQFPAGMAIGPIPSLSTTCTGAPAPVATAGSTSVTWAAGGRIPAGGCSISFAISATASITPYVNTIPAGTLTTTSGTNTVAAQATITVGTDFSIDKQVRPGTTDPLTKTASLGILQTMQYVLTISNSSVGGTGSVTFTDSLPARITPLLSISALHSGGGSCNVSSTAATIVPARVFGTVTDAVAGSTCIVTITAKGSSTTATFLNTATVAAIASTADVDSTDNSSTATVTLTSIANITISKTNGLGGTVQAGQIVVYTVTVAHLGGSPATPSFLLDPGGVPGLSCTNVTCAPTGTGSACPIAGSTTIAYLQGSAGTGLGIQLNTFSQNQTLTFAVTCGVTATGLP